MTSRTSIPVGIYWKPGVWDLARSAYVADLDTDPESPGAFVGWLARALESHARRFPQQRADLASAAEQHPAQFRTRKSFNMKHDLPASTIEAVEDAVVADRQELGRVVARSAFAREAVVAAADEARRRLGPRSPSGTAEAQQPTTAAPAGAPGLSQPGTSSTAELAKAVRCVAGRGHSRAHAPIRYPRAGSGRSAAGHPGPSGAGTECRARPVTVGDDHLVVPAEKDDPGGVAHILRRGDRCRH